MRHSTSSPAGWWPALALALVLVLSASGPARAQEPWSIVLTPQIWASHIAKNGFVAGVPNTIFFTQGLSNTGKASVDSDPDDVLNPQFGLQAAFQYGRWTLAGAAQYVHFKTENDVTVSQSGRFCFNIIAGATPPCQFTTSLPAGTRLFKEEVTVDRIDADLALSYFFPDVVKDVLDVSAGVGLKFIYATADREMGDVFGQIQQDPGAFYCTGSNCKSPSAAVRGDKAKVESDDYWYGVTFPMSFAFQLSRDKKWLLPLNVSPFIGAETRDDKDVAYEINTDGTPKRIDGTTFAYGVTSDLTVRYIFDNGISPYLGFRVQYLNGHETFLAWGPLAGVSFRFGGP